MSQECPCVYSGLPYRCCCRLPPWIMSQYHLGVLCVSDAFLQIDPAFLNHSRPTSLVVCDMYAQRYQQTKSERVNRVSKICPVLFWILRAEVHCTHMVADIIEESLSFAVLNQLGDNQSP